MSKSTKRTTSRREFLKTGGQIAATTAVMAGAVPAVHAAQDDTLRLALIGCGGRGTGAASQALSVPNGRTKLVAMADVFENKLNGSHGRLSKRPPEQFDVPNERKFLGFDGYKKAMDCLKPGDIAILTTPPAFRWPFFKLAVEKGLHVFMEKPVTVDGPTTRKMLELSKEADKKNLKVGVGLMVRHCRQRQELHDRIKNGEIGEIIAMRGYRMCGRACTCGPPPDNMSELLYQIRNFHKFLWASGGMYSDFYIHQIDELSWMKDAWPVEARALGGRHYRDTGVDQNFDTYSVEYTYPDGTKLFYYGRAMSGCQNEFASYVHGTKGCGIVSTSSHVPGRCRTFKGQHFTKEAMTWAAPNTDNPYQLEWNDLIQAIREDKPYNEAKRGAEGSMVSSMGRMAAHTGQPITFEGMLNCEHEMAPDVDKFAADSPPPVKFENGRYPWPEPGMKKNREY